MRPWADRWSVTLLFSSTVPHEEIAGRHEHDAATIAVGGVDGRLNGGGVERCSVALRAEIADVVDQLRGGFRGGTRPIRVVGGTGAGAQPSGTHRRGDESDNSTARYDIALAVACQFIRSIRNVVNLGLWIHVFSPD